MKYFETIKSKWNIFILLTQNVLTFSTWKKKSEMIFFSFFPLKTSWKSTFPWTIFSSDGTAFFNGRLLSTFLWPALWETFFVFQSDLRLSCYDTTTGTGELKETPEIEIGQHCTLVIVTICLILTNSQIQDLLRESELYPYISASN